MKAVLMSIKPEYCAPIANGKKTIEVRKSRPKIKTPFKVYIYCSKSRPYLVYGSEFDGHSFIDKYTFATGRSKAEIEKIWGLMNGKVIGEFICDEITEFFPERYPFNEAGTCLTPLQIMDYANGKKAYGWHISDLVIYDEPKELNEFSKECPSNNCWECPYSISSDPRYFYEETKIVGCRNNVKRPPQSWCYVEEMNNG